MKEMYEAPELNLISYFPNEKLATFDFEGLLNGEGGQSNNSFESGDPFDF